MTYFDGLHRYIDFTRITKDRPIYNIYGEIVEGVDDKQELPEDVQEMVDDYTS